MISELYPTSNNLNFIYSNTNVKRQKETGGADQSYHGNAVP